jgi:hypothetical protein
MQSASDEHEGIRQRSWLLTGSDASVWFAGACLRQLRGRGGGAAFTGLNPALERVQRREGQVSITLRKQNSQTG